MLPGNSYFQLLLYNETSILAPPYLYPRRGATQGWEKSSLRGPLGCFFPIPFCASDKGDCFAEGEARQKAGKEQGRFFPIPSLAQGKQAASFPFPFGDRSSPLLCLFPVGDGESRGRVRRRWDVRFLLPCKARQSKSPQRVACFPISFGLLPCSPHPLRGKGRARGKGRLFPQRGASQGKSKNNKIKERYHEVKLLQGILVFHVVDLEPPSMHEYLR